MWSVPHYSFLPSAQAASDLPFQTFLRPVLTAEQGLWHFLELPQMLLVTLRIQHIGEQFCIARVQVCYSTHLFFLLCIHNMSFSPQQTGRSHLGKLMDKYTSSNELLQQGAFGVVKSSVAFCMQVSGFIPPVCVHLFNYI